MANKTFLGKVISIILTFVIFTSLTVQTPIFAAEENTKEKITMTKDGNGKYRFHLGDREVDEDTLTETMAFATYMNGFEKTYKEIIEMFNMNPDNFKYEYINFPCGEEYDMIDAIIETVFLNVNIQYMQSTEMIDIANMIFFMRYFYNKLYEYQQNGNVIYMNR